MPGNPGSQEPPKPSPFPNAAAASATVPKPTLVVIYRVTWKEGQAIVHENFFSSQPPQFGASLGITNSPTVGIDGVTLTVVKPNSLDPERVASVGAVVVGAV